MRACVRAGRERIRAAAPRVRFSRCALDVSVSPFVHLASDAPFFRSPFLSARTVTDAEGLLQPVAPCAPGGAPFALFLSGWVLPEEGPLPTAKGGAGLGRRVEALPITRIAFPAERAPGAPGAITLGTAAAIYTAVKPAAAYKKIFAAAEATAATAREALRALAGDAGGEGANPGIDLKEVRMRTLRGRYR